MLWARISTYECIWITVQSITHEFFDLVYILTEEDSLWSNTKPRLSRLGPKISEFASEEMA